MSPKAVRPARFESLHVLEFLNDVDALERHSIGFEMASTRLGFTDYFRLVVWIGEANSPPVIPMLLARLPSSVAPPPMENSARSFRFCYIISSAGSTRSSN